MSRLMKEISLQRQSEALDDDVPCSIQFCGGQSFPLACPKDHMAWLPSIPSIRICIRIHCIINTTKEIKSSNLQRSGYDCMFIVLYPYIENSDDCAFNMTIVIETNLLH